MDLEPLKEKLGDEMFAQVEAYVGDLVGQKDQARNESISGRKKLKTQVEELTTKQGALMERLGLDDLDDLDSLPDISGQAETTKQDAAKIKRLERELGKAQESIADQTKAITKSSKKNALNSALDKHEFLAKDLVEAFIDHRLVLEGEDWLYKQDDGNLVSVTDGVAGVAKTRPELLKPTGAGGAGVRSTNARGDGGQVTMTRAEFEQLPPAKQMEVSKSGVTLQ